MSSRRVSPQAFFHATQARMPLVYMSVMVALIVGSLQQDRPWTNPADSATSALRRKESLPQPWPTAAMVVRMGSEHSSSTRQTYKFHLKHPVIRVGTECSGMEPLPWVCKRLGLLDAFQLAFFSCEKGPSLSPIDHTMSGCMGTKKRTRRHQAHHAHRHHGPKSQGSARP